jgi:hypothetical protein
MFAVSDFTTMTYLLNIYCFRIAFSELNVELSNYTSKLKKLFPPEILNQDQVRTILIK